MIMCCWTLVWLIFGVLWFLMVSMASLDWLGVVTYHTSECYGYSYCWKFCVIFLLPFLYEKWVFSLSKYFKGSHPLIKVPFVDNFSKTHFYGTLVILRSWILHAPFSYSVTLLGLVNFFITRMLSYSTFRWCFFYSHISISLFPFKQNKFSLRISVFKKIINFY